MPINAKELQKLEEHKKRLQNTSDPEAIKKLEDKFHQKTPGLYIGDFVFGANDGLITTFAIVAGSWGAGLPTSIILILGFANLLADGISMGLGNYQGSKSERDFGRKQMEKEKWEIKNIPHVESKEIRDIFQGWGFTGADLDRAVQIVTSDEKIWLDIMMKHELGIFSEFQKSPTSHGLVTFGSFVLAGIVPLLPFLFLGIGSQAFILSIILTGVTMFTIGALRSILSPSRWFKSGLEVLLIGSVAAFAAYFVGDIIEKIIN